MPGLTLSARNPVLCGTASVSVVRPSGRDYAIIFDVEDLHAVLAHPVGRGSIFVPASADIEAHMATEGTPYEDINRILGVDLAIARFNEISDALRASLAAPGGREAGIYLRAHDHNLLGVVSRVTIVEAVIRTLRARGAGRLLIRDRSRRWAQSIWAATPSPGPDHPADRCGVLPIRRRRVPGMHLRRAMAIVARIASHLPEWLLWRLLTTMARATAAASGSGPPGNGSAPWRLYVPRPGTEAEFLDEMAFEDLAEGTAAAMLVDSAREGRGRLGRREVAELGAALSLEGRWLVKLATRALAASMILRRHRPLRRAFAANAEEIAGAFKLRPRAIAEVEAIVRDPGLVGVSVDTGCYPVQRLVSALALEARHEVKAYMHGLLLLGNPYLKGMPGLTVVAWNEAMAGEIAKVGMGEKEIAIRKTRRTRRVQARPLAPGERPRLLFAPSHIFDQCYFLTWREQLEAARAMSEAADAIGVDFVIQPSPRGGARTRRFWEALGEVAYEGSSLAQSIGSCHLFATIASTVFCDFVLSGAPVAVVDLQGWVKQGGIPFDAEHGIYRVRRAQDARRVLRDMCCELAGALPEMGARRADLGRALAGPNPA